VYQLKGEYQRAQGGQARGRVKANPGWQTSKWPFSSKTLRMTTDTSRHNNASFGNRAIGLISDLAAACRNGRGPFHWGCIP
jgi:hypothetical protein